MGYNLNELNFSRDHPRSRTCGFAAACKVSKQQSASHARLWLQSTPITDILLLLLLEANLNLNQTLQVAAVEGSTPQRYMRYTESACTRQRLSRTHRIAHATERKLVPLVGSVFTSKYRPSRRRVGRLTRTGSLVVAVSLHQIFTWKKVFLSTKSPGPAQKATYSG